MGRVIRGVPGVDIMTLSEKAKFTVLVNEVMIIQNQLSKVNAELMKLLISINQRESQKTKLKEEDNEIHPTDQQQ